MIRHFIADGTEVEHIGREIQMEEYPEVYAVLKGTLTNGDDGINEQPDRVA